VPCSAKQLTYSEVDLLRYLSEFWRSSFVVLSIGNSKSNRLGAREPATTNRVNPSTRTMNMRSLLPRVTHFACSTKKIYFRGSLRIYILVLVQWTRQRFRFLRAVEADSLSAIFRHFYHFANLFCISLMLYSLERWREFDCHRQPKAKNAQNYRSTAIKESGSTALWKKGIFDVLMSMLHLTFGDSSCFLYAVIAFAAFAWA